MSLVLQASSHIAQACTRLRSPCCASVANSICPCFHALHSGPPGYLGGQVYPLPPPVRLLQVCCRLAEAPQPAPAPAPREPQIIEIPRPESAPQPIAAPLPVPFVFPASLFSPPAPAPSPLATSDSSDDGDDDEPVPRYSPKHRKYGRKTVSEAPLSPRVARTAHHLALSGLTSLQMPMCSPRPRLQSLWDVSSHPMQRPCH
jgi:hypothetical protein